MQAVTDQKKTIDSFANNGNKECTVLQACCLHIKGMLNATDLRLPCGSVLLQSFYALDTEGTRMVPCKYYLSITIYDC